jgi:predicted MFS family arabinose efflux permease
MTAMPVHAATPWAAAFNLFVIGTIAFLTVVDLFAMQAILPSLAAHYDVTPAMIGAAANACTFGMAAGGVLAAIIGAHVDKRSAIALCLALLAVPTAMLAFAPDLVTFSILRVVQGVLMSSAFAMTLAHLGERCDASASPAAFAAYVSGNVASNLFGRLIAAGAVAEIGLSGAFWLFAVLNLAGAVLALQALSRAPMRGPAAPISARVLFEPLRVPELRSAFAIGFCILFAFVGVFTYVNFALMRAPIGLGMTELGFVCLVFLPSLVTTPLAGRAAARLGARAAALIGLGVAGLGLVGLGSGSLWATLAGMAAAGAGTFFAQAAATGFVSRSVSAARASASGVYLASYIARGFAGAALLGWAFEAGGWSGCLIGIAAALSLGAALALAMREPAGVSPCPRP